MKNQLFARKSLAQLLDEMAGENRLRRVLGPVQLTSLGVGAIIGAGIFVATGAAARNVAGPGADALVRRGRASPASSPRSATPSSPRWCRWPARPTPTPTPRSASCSPGSSAGTWSSSTRSASATVANGWSGYFQSVLGEVRLAAPARRWPGRRSIYDTAAGQLRPDRRRRQPAGGPDRGAGHGVLVKGIQESASFNATMVVSRSPSCCS